MTLRVFLFITIIRPIRLLSRRMGGRAASPESYKTISDSESSEYASPPPVKKARTSITKSVKRSTIKVQSKIGNRIDLTDIEDLGSGISRPHGPEYHSVDEVAKLQRDLLSWFEGVRDKRGMPWRKRYDHNLSATEKGQRAYEVSLESREKSRLTSRYGVTWIFAYRVMSNKQFPKSCCSKPKSPRYVSIKH